MGLIVFEIIKLSGCSSVSSRGENGLRSRGSFAAPDYYSIRFWEKVSLSVLGSLYKFAPSSSWTIFVTLSFYSISSWSRISMSSSSFKSPSVSAPFDSTLSSTVWTMTARFFWVLLIRGGALSFETIGIDTCEPVLIDNWELFLRCLIP